MGETFTGITATICVGSLVIAGVAMSVIMIVYDWRRRHID